MNIFEAAWEAFPQGKGIGLPCIPDITIQDDDEVEYLVAVTDEGVAHVGWNPTAQELTDEDWITKERIEIKSRVHPSDHF